MGIFRRKNDFGEYRWRRPTGEHLFWFGILVGIALTLGVLIPHGCAPEKSIDIASIGADEELVFGDELNDLNFDKSGIRESKTVDEEYPDLVNEPPVLKDEKKNPEKILRYVYRWSPVEKRRRFLTTYSKWDSPAEMKGIYANQKFAQYLNIYERRIRDKHYAVALNLTDANYHNALVRLPNGAWTHKYRVHVPNYNTSAKPSLEAARQDDAYLGSDISSLILALGSSSYFSQPYDRMSHGRDKKNHNGRCDYCEDEQILDVLHTGYEGIVKQKQKKWKKSNQKYTDVVFWELCKFAQYSGGFERQVTMDEAHAINNNGKVRIAEFSGGRFTE